MTVRELIMELRKIGNHDALVQLLVVRRDDGQTRDIEAIETQDTIGKANVIVYLRDLKEPGDNPVPIPLSASRRIVWQ
jgi:hypothetical protein